MTGWWPFYGRRVDAQKGLRNLAAGYKRCPRGVSQHITTRRTQQLVNYPGIVYYPSSTNTKMNCSLFAVATSAVILILLVSQNSSTTIPMINCEPNSLTEAPAKIRQLCYYVMEQIRSEQPQDNADIIDNKLYERGIKRQDVDHVFLRFGRRFGL